MTKRDVFQLRLRAGERERWLAAAGPMPLATWMRETLNEAARAEEAVRRDFERQVEERARIRAAVSPDRAFRPDFK